MGKKIFKVKDSIKIEYSMAATNTKKNNIYIHFNNEFEEQQFIHLLINNTQNENFIHTSICDLDVDIEKYKKYFCCSYSINHKETPSPIITSKNLDTETLNNIINNWGYFTFDAYLFWTEVPLQDDSPCTETANLTINQIHDYTLNIIANNRFFLIVQEIISKFLLEKIKI